MVPLSPPQVIELFGGLKQLIILEQNGGTGLPSIHWEFGNWNGCIFNI